LDTSACARIYLYKLLGKIKAVAESPNLPPEVRTVGKLSEDVAVLNVHARLCKSNPVKEALPGVLSDVGSALGVRIKDEGGAAGKRVRPKKEETVTTTAKALPREGGKAQLEVEGKALEGSASEAEDDIPDDGLERFNDRLASSDDDEDELDEDDEDLDVEAIERKLEQEGIARMASKALTPKYDPKNDMEITEDEDDLGDSAASSPEPRKAPALKKSAFVPSLSMAGYISGSGSDIEEIDEAPRKNRRGQRARQQIWEKKFGAKAQHLQKQQDGGGKQAGGRDAGWDPKRGATDGTEGRNIGRKFPERATRRQYGKAARPSVDGARPDPKHRDDDGTLHPSWAAAKLAKEKKVAAPAAFQGKKITFG